MQPLNTTWAERIIHAPHRRQTCQDLSANLYYGISTNPLTSGDTARAGSQPALWI